MTEQEHDRLADDNQEMGRELRAALDDLENLQARFDAAEAARVRHVHALDRQADTIAHLRDRIRELEVELSRCRDQRAALQGGLAAAGRAG